MKLRTKKQRASPTNLEVAGDVASTSASASKKRRTLPDELWDKILESVDDNSVMAFASVSKQLRRVQRRSGRKLKTDMLCYASSSLERRYFVMQLFKYAESSSLSEDRCLWTMTLPSAGIQQKQSEQIVNAAAFWGHLGALKYWKERTRAKKSPFDKVTSAFAALGGQVEVLVWLREK